MEAEQRKNIMQQILKWSDSLFGNKVASIPFVAIDKLNKQGIMKGYKMSIDQKEIIRLAK